MNFKKFFGIVLALNVIFITKISAAEYMWPVGGENAYETYIEYGYERRTYDTTAYDKKYDYEPREQVYGVLSRCAGTTTCDENHYGVDITGIKGNTYSIASVSDGKVIATSANRYFYPGVNFVDRNQRQDSRDGGGYGNYVMIQDESTGLCFLYAHMKGGSISVKAGDKVFAGQIIGVMGSSGDAGHMHVHFEVRPNLRSLTPDFGGSFTSTTGFYKETVDPRDYIGDVAPQRVVEQSEEIVQGIKEDSAQASITTDGNIINLVFDKEVLVNVQPVVEVCIGEYKYSAKYIGISLDNKTLVYKFDYNDVDILASGSIEITSNGGDVFNKNDFSVSANTYATTSVGVIDSYKVFDLYTNIVSRQAGDVNLDGLVNASDASIVMSLKSQVGADGYSSLNSVEKEQYARADVNGDGLVTMEDVSMILQYAANRGAGTEYFKLIKCDLNNDEIIDLLDYNILKQGIDSGSTLRIYDIDDNNLVNEQDIQIFRDILQKYGLR